MNDNRIEKHPNLRETNSSDEELIIDIEKIMEEIRLQIKNEQPKEVVPSLDEIPIPDTSTHCEEITDEEDWETFIDSFQEASQCYDIPYYWELPSCGIKKFAMRVVRKLNKFVLSPILERANHFRFLIVQCLNQLRFFVDDEKLRNRQMSGTIEWQRNEIAALHKEIDELRRNYTELIGDVAALKLHTEDNNNKKAGCNL